MNKRFKVGWEKLKELDDKQGDRLIDGLKDIAPSMVNYIIEFAMGDIYTREGLSLKERELLTICSLTTLGDTAPQIKVHVRCALNIGITPKEVTECVIHCLPYAGFPRTLNALSAVEEVFKERNIIK